MHTHLQFQSSLFQPIPGEQEETNEGVFGQHLAEFLSREISDRGFVTKNLIAEDWGWVVPVENEEFYLSFGCSSYEDDNQWLIQIHPSTPYIRRWFKKIDVRDKVEKLAIEIENVLATKGQATNLLWWSDKDSGRK